MAMRILVVGGNVLGIAARILTGRVLEATGSYCWTVAVAGALRIIGRSSC